MRSVSTALRRTILVLLLAGGAGAAVSWWRTRSSTPIPTAPPQWPPMPTPVAQTWLPALEDGTVPESHPIKLNESSGIFHVPGGRFYDRTKPERCYATAADAEADGYRQSKS